MSRIPKEIQALLSSIMKDIDSDDKRDHRKNTVIIIPLEHCDRVKGKYTFETFPVYQTGDDYGVLVPNPVLSSTLKQDVTTTVIRLVELDIEFETRHACQHKVLHLINKPFNTDDTDDSSTQDKPIKPS